MLMIVWMGLFLCLFLCIWMIIVAAPVVCMSSMYVMCMFCFVYTDTSTCLLGICFGQLGLLRDCL